jgi:hypothetical protein
MGKSATRGMAMGAIAIALGLVNFITDRAGPETPPASVQTLTWVLLALGIVGFVGSLVAYLKQKGQS